MKKYSIFGLLVLVLILEGCKAVPVLPSRAPLKNLATKELVRTIDTRQPKVKNMRARIKAVYNDGKRKQTVVLQMRLEHQAKLWLSASMLIPIAKALITPEQIQFYEKFQKTSFTGDFEGLNTLFKTSFGFDELERLFLGAPVLNLKQGRWKRINHPDFYVLSPVLKGAQFTPSFFFDPATFMLREQRVVFPGGATLTMRYPARQKIEDISLPSLIQLSFFDGKQFQTLDLEYTRVDYPKKLTFPFQIPEGYKAIQMP